MIKGRFFEMYENEISVQLAETGQTLDGRLYVHMHLNANHFLGYDKDADGNLVINDAQAEIVRRVFDEFMNGLNPETIAARLNDEGVPGCMGETEGRGERLREMAGRADDGADRAAAA